MIYLDKVPRPDSFIYLASPYTIETIWLRCLRYVQAVDATRYILQKGFPVYSPIVHWHEASIHYEIPMDVTYWSIFNKPFMDACSQMWVLMLDGWNESKGIEEETEYARFLDKPVRFLCISGPDLLMLDE